MMSGEPRVRIFTIGHSSHPPEHFLELLSGHSIEAVADTRSHPFSRFAPQFDSEALKKALHEAGIRYVYLGRELGGRPADASLYDESGRALYGRMAEEPAFLEGIARLEDGAKKFRTAILCSEEDPAHCHRHLLVGKFLLARGAEVLHIRAGGGLQTPEQLAEPDDDQLLLFDECQDDQWKSTRSVSRKRTRSSSLAC